MELQVPTTRDARSFTTLSSNEKLDFREALSACKFTNSLSGKITQGAIPPFADRVSRIEARDILHNEYLKNLSIYFLKNVNFRLSIFLIYS